MYVSQKKKIVMEDSHEVTFSRYCKITVSTETDWFFVKLLTSTITNILASNFHCKLEKLSISQKEKRDDNIYIYIYIQLYEYNKTDIMLRK